jgi:hypothetical protein
MTIEVVLALVKELLAFVEERNQEVQTSSTITQ